MLLQPGKTDAGALFTSGVSSAAMNPRGTASVLSKLTIVTATIFMLSALLLTLPAISGDVSVLQTQGENSTGAVNENSNSANANAANSNTEENAGNTAEEESKEDSTESEKSEGEADKAEDTKSEEKADSNEEPKDDQSDEKKDDK